MQLLAQPGQLDAQQNSAQGEPDILFAFAALQLCNFIRQITLATNDRDLALLQPAREFVFSAIVKHMRLKRSVPKRGEDGDLRHLRIFLETETAFGEAQKPLHDYGIRLRLGFKIKRNWRGGMDIRCRQTRSVPVVY